MSRFLEDTVQGRTTGPIPFLLRTAVFPLSLMYAGIVRFRNALYSLGILKTRSLSVPVISIGNLTAGGTGKTPLSLLAAEILLKKGCRPALIARGYKAGETGLNDELTMIQEILPDLKVYQDPDRYRAGVKAVEEGADIILLDDGFQHRKLARDIDILVIDAATLDILPFLMPCGPFREPWSSAERADITIITKCGKDKPESARLSRSGSLFFTRHTAGEILSESGTAAPESLKGRNIVLFSGIGDPSSFRTAAQQTGAVIVETVQFEDHHIYSEQDITSIQNLCTELGCTTALTTHKDMVKVRPLLKNCKNNIEFLTLTVRIHFLQDFEGFTRLITAAAEHSRPSDGKGSVPE